MDPALIAAACAALLIGLLAVIVASRRQEARARRFAAAAALAAAREGAFAQLIRGKHPKLIVGAAVPLGGQLEIRPEGAADRTAESLGFGERALSGDPSFDDRFHVDTDEPAFAQALLASSTAREAVERIFAAGFKSISWDEGRLAAEWPGYAPRDDSEPSFVADAARALAALKAAAPPAPPPPSGLTERAFRRAVTGLLVVSGTLLYAALIFSRSLPGRPVDGAALFLACLRPALYLEAAAAVLVAALLRGKSWFARGFSAAAFCGLLLFPTAAYFTLLAYNSLADSSPVASWDVPVVGTRRSSGRHSEYYLRVPDWHRASGTRELDVSYRAYSRARQGSSRLRLRTRAGRLGHEWIVSLDLIP